MKTACAISSRPKAVVVGSAIFDSRLIAAGRLSARKNTQATTTQRNVRMKAATLASGANLGATDGPKPVPGVIDAEIGAVQRAPDNERPGRAMPEPAEHHGDQQI